MKKILDFFIDNSLIVNLLTVIILIAGTMSLFSLAREIFPNVSYDVVTVKTYYPGSSAEDVEKLVTFSVERQVQSVDGIKDIHAMSSEGLSVVYLELDPDYDGDEVFGDIKDAVDLVIDLPEDVERPFVKMASSKDRGAIKIAVTGKKYDAIRTYAKKLRDEIELIDYVTTAEMGGYRKDEIIIAIDPIKLNKFELTASEVAASIENRNLNLSAGEIIGAHGDVFIRVVAEFSSVKEIRDVVVRSNSTGRKVYIKDVATVTMKLEEGAVLERSQGEQAIFLAVKTKSGVDLVDAANEIKNRTKDFFKKEKLISKGLSFRFADDKSYYVKRRLDVLVSNGKMGLVLVFICLLFFLNFRTSVVTSLGAPIAFMASFMVLAAMGQTMNMISMFALILVLGMLVDDSIIVSEHFYHYLEKGLAPKEAAKKAAWATIKPVTATVLTTMVAFGSLFFMGGIMGKFLAMVPLVVMICLAASLFECFVILPSHLADFVRISKKKQGKRWYEHLIKWYGKILKPALKHPVLVFILFSSIFAHSMYTAKNMSFELFPGDDVRILILSLKGDLKTTLDDSNKAMMKSEKIVLDAVKDSELDQIRSQVGSLLNRFSAKRGDHYSTMVIYLTPPAERKRNTDEIINDFLPKIKAAFPRYVVSLEKLQGGPPKGAPVEIEVLGESLAQLKEVSHKVEEELKKVKGVTTTEIDFEEGKKQLVAKVDIGEVKRLGLTTKQVAYELRQVLAGDVITQIRRSDEDIDIKMYLDDHFRSRIDSISLLYVLNRFNKRIAISKVVKLVEEDGAFVIRRLNRKRVISITGSLNKELITPIEVVKQFTPVMSKIIKDYPDVTYNFSGENKDTQKSMTELAKAAALATMCIFFILVVMFSSLWQPIVIMMAIPLGLSGVVYTFKILGMSLGFMALMGVVALVGVVVNDSIVLVSFINKLREEKPNDNLIDIVLEASKLRFRPVILTTFTTCVGLFPIAHAPNGDPFLKPMAISFAWGLLVATFITLVFIPCNYVIYEKVIRRIYLGFIDLYNIIKKKRKLISKVYKEVKQES